MAARTRIKLNWLDWVSWIVVIIGALNWGLIGFAGFDLIGSLLGGTFTPGARIIFAIIGLAGIWSIYTFYKVYAIITGGLGLHEDEKIEDISRAA